MSQKCPTTFHVPSYRETKIGRLGFQSTCMLSLFVAWYENLFALYFLYFTSIGLVSIVSLEAAESLLSRAMEHIEDAEIYLDEGNIPASCYALKEVCIYLRETVNKITKYSRIRALSKSERSRLESKLRGFYSETCRVIMEVYDRKFYVDRPDVEKLISLAKASVNNLKEALDLIRSSKLRQILRG